MATAPWFFFRKQLDYAKLAYDCDGDAPQPPFCVYENAGCRVILRVRKPNGADHIDEQMFQNVVEIAFRGTDNEINWIQNFNIQLVSVDIGAKKGRVHAGFQQAYKSLRYNILQCFRDLEGGTLVLITGHSLGGALSQLCAYDIASDGTRQCCEVFVTTWGAPRVGDEAFRSDYSDWVTKTTRFVNCEDVVPKLPPLDNYVHVGGLVYLDAWDRTTDLVRSLAPSLSSNSTSVSVSTKSITKDTDALREALERAHKLQKYEHNSERWLKDLYDLKNNNVTLQNAARMLFDQLVSNSRDESQQPSNLLSY